MSTPAIEIERMTKVYGKTLAVADLSLEVQPGEVVGFLGPNGAGKTTTQRVLMDLIRPTYGSARVLGLDCQADSQAVRRRVGYLPGELALWKGMTGRRLLDHVAGLRAGDGTADVEALVEALGIDLSRDVGELSTGNKQKLGLVQAFMGEPEVLILDEPTSGLDPLMQQTFHEMVRQATARGATIFLSSHVLSEVEAVCDRVAIIRQGTLAEVAPMDALATEALRRVEVRLVEPAAAADALAELAGVTELERFEDRLRFVLEGPMDPLVKTLARYEVVDLRVREPDLEEVFLAYYGGERRGA